MSQELKDIRYAMETQFRYRLYQTTDFPFLHSIGIQHIIQGFADKDGPMGFIGMLHLWYENNSGEPSYQSKTTHFLNGNWKSEWFDTAQEGLELTIKLENEKPYTLPERLIPKHLWDKEVQNSKELVDKHIKRKLEKEMEGILWN